MDVFKSILRILPINTATYYLAKGFQTYAKSTDPKWDDKVAKFILLLVDDLDISFEGIKPSKSLQYLIENLTFENMLEGLIDVLRSAAKKTEFTKVDDEAVNIAEALLEQYKLINRSNDIVKA